MNSLVSCFIHFFILFQFWTSSISACHINHKLKKWLVGREFFLSDEAPISNVLNTIPGVADDAHLLLDHIRNVENAVYVGRQTERGNLATNVEVPFETCNYREKQFGNSALAKFVAAGWPLADTSCVTDQFSESATEYLAMTKTDGSEYLLEDVHTALSNYRKTLNNTAKRLAVAAGLNVSSANAGVNHKMSFFSGETCILQSAAAVRFDDIWYLEAPFSSLVLHENVVVGTRSVVEYPTVQNGTFSTPKKICMRVDNDTLLRKEGTTIIGFWNGSRYGGRPSTFGKVTLDQTPSVKAALEKLENSIQQANDALAPSSIAILVLPLFLNLIPIALLSSVTTFFMLFYTLLTDILTVVPMGIKGVELISIGSLTHKSLVVRISSSVVLPRSKSAAAELWSSECYAPSSVHGRGVFFLVLSIVFMVIGIVIEILAQVYMKRKQAYMKKEFQEAEPFFFENGGYFRREMPFWRTPGEMQILLPVPQPIEYYQKRIDNSLLYNEDIIPRQRQPS